MFNAYLDFFKNLVLSLPFNIFDYGIIIVFLLYVFEDVSFGAIASGISLISTVASFFIGIALYPILSSLISHQFQLPKGISDALSFLIISTLGFLIVSFLLSLIRKRFVSIHLPKQIDIVGGVIFGSISFFFIGSFVIALLLSFPTSSVVKDLIRTSSTAKIFSTNTQGIDRSVRRIFGGAIEDTINFLTVEPNSDASVNLHFKTTSYSVDVLSESQMFDLVNKERRKAGRPELSMDSSLTKVAREHAKDMLARGYFSHYTLEGLSPFDRMGQANISYQYAGENLAFAPDVVIAMDGLMKSKGHRENILSQNFGRVGIGVLDAGIFGKMFVQEFTD